MGKDGRTRDDGADAERWTLRSTPDTDIRRVVAHSLDGRTSERKRASPRRRAACLDAAQDRPPQRPQSSRSPPTSAELSNGANVGVSGCYAGIDEAR